MSGKTSSVVLLETLLLVPALAAFGAVKLTGKALSALQEEYRKATDAERAKYEAELERRSALFRSRQDQVDRVSNLVERTVVEGQANTTELMIADRMSILRQRIEQFAGCPPDILEKVKAFEERVAAGSSSLSDVIRESSALASEISKASVSKQPSIADMSAILLDEIRAMRDEIAFGLPDSGTWSTVRRALLFRVDDLQRLAAAEPIAAGQGVAMLRERVARHTREYLETGQREQEYGLEDEQIDTLPVEMQAKLSVVSLYEEFPDLSERAKELIRRHGQSSSSADRRSDLSSIRAEVDGLMSELLVRSAGDEISAIVSHHVKDVLLTLGYRVRETPSPSASQTTFVTPIAANLGVEFSVNGTGQVTTEMVSLSDRVRAVSPALEESACELADRVRRGLNERGLKAQEKTRYHLRPGETLRKVNLQSDSDTRDDQADELNRRLVGEIE